MNGRPTHAHGAILVLLGLILLLRPQLMVRKRGGWFGKLEKYDLLHRFYASRGGLVGLRVCGAILVAVGLVVATY